MPIPEFYRRDHFDRMTDDEIKEAARRHDFSLEELLSQNFITQDRYRQLTYIGPDEHYQNLANPSARPDLATIYTKEGIKQLIQTGQISEFTLLQKGIYSQEQLDYIMDRGPQPPEPPPLEELPKLLTKRVDVFVLGVANSGKSSFLAGLFYGANIKGNYFPQMVTDESDNIITQHGMLYGDYLINCLDIKLPPARTRFEYITYIPINLRDEAKKEHPLSFMEMSGEVFQDCYGKNKNQLHQKLQTYLFSPNEKIIICVIDFKKISEGMSPRQSQQFTWFLNLLDTTKTLARCTAISILITKWDQSPDKALGASQRYIESKYLNLHNTCQQYAAKNKIPFLINTFSLGTFDNRNTVKYEPRDSEKILNWLIKITSTIR